MAVTDECPEGTVPVFAEYGSDDFDIEIPGISEAEDVLQGILISQNIHAWLHYILQKAFWVEIQLALPKV